MTFRNLQNRCFTSFQRTPSSVVISGSSYHVVRQPEESISILHTTGPPSQDEQTKLSPVFFACEDQSRKIHGPSQHLSVVLLMVQKSSGCTSWGTGSWNPIIYHCFSTIPAPRCRISEPSTVCVYTYPKDPFVCPKKGIGPPTFLFWGWDCDHQSYSREVFGFLGIYHQTLQVPKMEVLTYISCMDTAYVRENPPPK